MTTKSKAIAKNNDDKGIGYDAKPIRAHALIGGNVYTFPIRDADLHTFGLLSTELPSTGADRFGFGSIPTTITGEEIIIEDDPIVLSIELLVVSATFANALGERTFLDFNRSYFENVWPSVRPAANICLARLDRQEINLTAGQTKVSHAERIAAVDKARTARMFISAINAIVGDGDAKRHFRETLEMWRIQTGREYDVASALLSRSHPLACAA